MAQIKFQKDRSKNNPKPVEETHISKPNQIYSYQENKNPLKSENNKKKKKIYSTIRVQRESVHELNALQNSLGFNTQDEFLKYLLDKEKNIISDRQKTMFNMYMDTYEARDRRK